MSSYGLELINNVGKSLVDENYQNYVFRSSGTLTDSDFSNYTYNSKACKLDIDNLNSPILFLIPTTNFSRVTMWNKLQYIVAPPTTPQAAKKCFQLTTWSNITVASIQYYVFDMFIPSGTGEYGIQVRKPNSDLVFDSNWDFLRLLGVHWLDPGFPSYLGGELNWTSIGTFNPGKQIAASMPYARQYLMSSGTSANDVLAEGFWLNPLTNEIRVSIMPIGQLLWGGWGDGYIQKDTRSQVMICDVSGLPLNYNPLPLID